MGLKLNIWHGKPVQNWFLAICQRCYVATLEDDKPPNRWICWCCELKEAEKSLKKVG